MTKLHTWKIGWIAFVFCAATAIIAQAQTFTTLANFDGENGETPSTALTQATDGNLYGTTTNGGDLTCDPPYGCGTVFRITNDGVLTTIHIFEERDGQFPLAQLIVGNDGNLYGTTDQGGANSYGTVFRVKPNGSLTTLYTFDGVHGAYPQSAPIEAVDRNFYGTTTAGGLYDQGTVFKLTPEGTLTTLYSFCAQTYCPDGFAPLGDLVEGINGNFSGTTFLGGANSAGTIFKITPRGNLTTLYSFCSQSNCTDGNEPFGGLFMATNGKLYGTTIYGGATNDGTLLEISSGGTLKTVHSFDSTGEYPYAGVVQATDGSLYGTTTEGGVGSYQVGTIFKITADGELTTLHDFCSQQQGGYCSDGYGSVAALFQATNGILYGTTQVGGTSPNCGNANQGCGIVYSLDIGQHPFIAFVRAAGKVGQTGGILGQGFTGTTSVSLNGIAANFTVVSDTFIKATVPAGATTGFVTVTTPTGVLTSNVPFQVIP
jgi:uncharacterized repeat protein (TIGR03803 family)